MKKLMIAAAAAAMIGGAYAGECVTQTIKGDKDKCTGVRPVTTYTAGATAYKFSATLKTSDFKTKTAKAKCGVGACEFWKAQTTKKYAGLIIDDSTCGGCEIFPTTGVGYFWNITDKEPVAAGLAFTLGRLDKNGKKAEAYGTWSDGDQDFGTIAFAGFGALNVKNSAKACCAENCSAYLKNVSGNAAGALVCAVPNACTEIAYDCERCITTGKEFAAASGTWKLSYDASTAKKVAKAAIKAAAAAAADDDDAEEVSIFEDEEVLMDTINLPAYVEDAIEEGEYEPVEIEVVIEEGEDDEDDEDVED